MYCGIKKWKGPKDYTNFCLQNCYSYLINLYTTKILQDYEWMFSLTCGSLPRPAPPPTAMTGTPVWAETNSSIGANGARLGGGGFSSSNTRPCSGVLPSNSHNCSNRLPGLLSFTANQITLAGPHGVITLSPTCPDQARLKTPVPELLLGPAPEPKPAAEAPPVPPTPALVSGRWEEPEWTTAMLTPPEAPPESLSLSRGRSSSGGEGWAGPVHASTANKNERAGLAAMTRAESHLGHFKQEQNLEEGKKKELNVRSG